MSRRDSDLLYFSVLFLLAVFAIPAIAGPCLALDECPVAVASNCHDEEGEQGECCCGIAAVPDATRDTVKHKASSWLVENPQLVGVAGYGIPAPGVPLETIPPPSRNESLFVLNGSFLI